MQSNSFRRLLFVCLTLAPYSAKAVSIVNYTGGAGASGMPLPGVFATAGTFKPGFDPYSYKYVYGDAWGNMLTTNYSQAVADGNFMPIGSGAFTNAFGAYSGSGVATVPDDEQIWLFTFDNVDPDAASNFALASNPNWLVATPTVSIQGVNATEFVFGRPGPYVFELNTLPMPEPGTMSIAIIAIAAFTAKLRRREALR